MTDLSSSDSLTESKDVLTSVEVVMEEIERTNTTPKRGKRSKSERKVLHEVRVSSQTTSELLVQSVDDFCKDLPPETDMMYGALPKLQTEYTLALLKIERDLESKQKEQVELSKGIKDWEERIESIKRKVSSASIGWNTSTLSPLFSNSTVSVSSLTHANRNIETVLSESYLFSSVSARCDVLARILNSLIDNNSPHSGDATVLHRVVGEWLMIRTYVSRILSLSDDLGGSHRRQSKAKRLFSNLEEKVETVGRLARSFVCSRLVVIFDTSLHTNEGQEELKEISAIVRVTQDVDKEFGAQVLNIIKSLVLDSITSLVQDVRLTCRERALSDCESGLRCAYEVICLWNGELSDFISCWISSNFLKVHECIFNIVQQEIGKIISAIVGGVTMGANLESIEVNGLLDLANFFEIWAGIITDYGDSEGGLGKEVEDSQNGIYLPMKNLVLQEYLTRCREQLDEWFHNVYNPDNFQPVHQFSTLFTTLPADIISVLSIHMNVAKDTLRMSKGGTYFMVVGVVLQCLRSHQERHVEDACRDFARSVACANDCLALAEKVSDNPTFKRESQIVNMLTPLSIILTRSSTSGSTERLRTTTT
jgi:hypothetical protein